MSTVHTSLLVFPLSEAWTSKKILLDFVWVEMHFSWSHFMLLCLLSSFSLGRNKIRNINFLPFSGFSKCRNRLFFFWILFMFFHIKAQIKPLLRRMGCLENKLELFVFSWVWGFLFLPHYRFSWVPLSSIAMPNHPIFLSVKVKNLPHC